MDFASQDDLVRATIMMALHLPRLLRAFEDGVEDLGLEIVERLALMDEDGVARPVLLLRGKRLHFRLGLRNAMEEFLAVDREAKPLRVDPGLADDAYARSKIEDIVSGWTAILEVLEESQDVREAQTRIGELQARFEWLRAVFVEERNSGRIERGRRKLTPHSHGVRLRKAPPPAIVAKPAMDTSPSESFDTLEADLLDLRKRLLAHPIYREVHSVKRLHSFMEAHVFAVWDFMSLAKRLQRDLTSIELPWTPPRCRASARFINEIILTEETDLGPDGRPLSHLELYLEAMEEVEADTRPFRRFLHGVEAGVDVAAALVEASTPGFVRNFVVDTIATAQDDSTVQVAASFLFAREDVIPEMFARLLESSEVSAGPHFTHYLRRHIEVDGKEHGPFARKLLEEVAGDDPGRWQEASRSASMAIEARLRLWDALCVHILGDEMAR